MGQGDFQTGRSAEKEKGEEERQREEEEEEQGEEAETRIWLGPTGDLGMLSSMIISSFPGRHASSPDLQESPEILANVTLVCRALHVPILRTCMPLKMMIGGYHCGRFFERQGREHEQ